MAGLSKRLSAIDAEIKQFARDHLAPAFGAERAAELARKVVLSREKFEWFVDRPDEVPSEAAIAKNDIAVLRVARIALGTHLEHMDCLLPSVEDLPSGEALAQLHDDLVRAEQYAKAASRHPSLRVRIDTEAAIDLALRAATALEGLRRICGLINETPWITSLADRSFFANGNDALTQLVRDFADDARPALRERERYLARPVELPEAFSAVALEVTDLVHKLAAGEHVFGIFAFSAKAIRPVVNDIRITGRTPDSQDDWVHVRDYLTWHDGVSSLIARWRALADEIGGPVMARPRELVQLMTLLDAVMVEGPAALEVLEHAFAQLVPGGASARSLWPDAARLRDVEDIFRNAAASTRLARSRSIVGRLEQLFPSSSGKLGELARHLLGKEIGNERIGTDQVLRHWTALRNEIDGVNQHRAKFDLVRDITVRINKAGAPTWAKRLRSDPVQGDIDQLIPSDWSEAWEWAAALAHLQRIDRREQLKDLAEQRTLLDIELKRTFEGLVRERTFYALARSMTGTVRGALMMFATALYKGKGTGKGAARYRRDARTAMAQCYGAVPCWIMPTWRVAEQLPGEVGSFDLVIMDEASQSDIRELPALLRGKKILVVGDDKQVSPTAAFIDNAKIDRLERSFLKGQAFKSILLPGSSLYDLAKVMFPDKLVMLKEHFRCVEPIIRFSMRFYPEPLVPLRVPTTQERLDPPLVDIYVPDGRRTGDKQNRREAEIIVEEIRKLVLDPALSRVEGQERWRTIGVISLIGGKQAALVNRMLIEEIGDEVMRRHHIACGDSATFQGDERDVVFLSMVADPVSKQAQTATQFEQRFNVAMSRARDRLVLVRSVTEEELKPDDLKARVIRHFRDPMAAACAPIGELGSMCESNFERDILRRLIDRGFQVTPQVGALGYRIDLVVEGPNGRRLAIECDGDKYHGPDRWADDMRRQRTLERVGWRFWRCWASSFALDPDGCMADLFLALERSRIHPGPTAEVFLGYTKHITALSQHACTTYKPASEADQVEVQVSGHVNGKTIPGLGEYGPAIASPSAIRVGDRVVVRYLDDGKSVAFTLSNARDDITNGFLAVSSPLGRELIGSAEEDEVEFGTGDGVRRVLVLRTERPAAAH